MIERGGAIYPCFVGVCERVAEDILCDAVEYRIWYNKACGWCFFVCVFVGVFVSGVCLLLLVLKR